MKAWPLGVTLEVAGLGQILFCHATPTYNTRVFTALTPEEKLQPLFKGVSAQIVVCGHTRMPFDQRVGDLRVVNAGSVGMPFGEVGASWLLLDQAIVFKQTYYDLMAAARQVRQTDSPEAEDFAVVNILSVPTEAEALSFL